jgi:hypothetical protein
MGPFGAAAAVAVAVVPPVATKLQEAAGEGARVPALSQMAEAPEAPGPLLAELEEVELSRLAEPEVRQVISTRPEQEALALDLD